MRLDLVALETKISLWNSSNSSTFSFFLKTKYIYVFAKRLRVPREAFWQHSAISGSPKKPKKNKFFIEEKSWKIFWSPKNFRAENFKIFIENFRKNRKIEKVGFQLKIFRIFDFRKFSIEIQLFRNFSTEIF